MEWTSQNTQEKYFFRRKQRTLTNWFHNSVRNFPKVPQFPDSPVLPYIVCEGKLRAKGIFCHEAEEIESFYKDYKKHVVDTGIFQIQGLSNQAELQKTEDFFRIFRRSIRTRCRLNLSLNVQQVRFTNIGNPKRYFGYGDSTRFFDRTLSLI